MIVAAAADTQFAFEEIGASFQKETGYAVTFVFGSSGSLAQQIINGAPVDLFASADEKYVAELKAQGLVEDSVVYARGRIVLAVNKGLGVDVTGLPDLRNPRVKKIAMANPEHAPYGRAAKEALLAQGLWDEVKPKVVYGENVRQALQFVQTGNAEAGIVALSVAQVPEVIYSIIDEDLHAPLVQSMALIKGSKKEEAARRFMTFVMGPESSLIMRKYGFVVSEE